MWYPTVELRTGHGSWTGCVPPPGGAIPENPVLRAIHALKAAIAWFELQGRSATPVSTKIAIGEYVIPNRDNLEKVLRYQTRCSAQPRSSRRSTRSPAADAAGYRERVSILTASSEDRIIQRTNPPRNLDPLRPSRNHAQVIRRRNPPDVLNRPQLTRMRTCAFPPGTTVSQLSEQICV